MRRSFRNNTTKLLRTSKRRRFLFRHKLKEEKVSLCERTNGVFTVKNDRLSRLVRRDVTRRSVSVANREHRRHFIFQSFVMNLRRGEEEKSTQSEGNTW